MMELPPKPVIKDIDTVGDKQISIDDLNDTVINNDEGLNTEILYGNDSQYNNQYMQAMQDSPYDSNINNSYNYDVNNNMDTMVLKNQI